MEPSTLKGLSYPVQPNLCSDLVKSFKLSKETLIRETKNMEIKVKHSNLQFWKLLNTIIGTFSSEYGCFMRFPL